MTKHLLITLFVSILYSPVSAEEICNRTTVFGVPVSKKCFNVEDPQSSQASSPATESNYEQLLSSCLEQGQSMDFCRGMLEQNTESSRGLMGGGERPKAQPSENPTCDAAIKSTEKKCKGAEWSQYSSMALQLGSTFVQMKNSGNIQAACETAKKINTLGATSNAAVAGMCKAAVMSCKRSCKDNEVDVESCEKFDAYTKVAAMQSMENAAAYAGSAACATAAGGKCSSDAAYNDEDCQQFCLKPGRQEHPKCQLALSSCSNTAYAAQNVQYCTCLNNPFAANCSRAAGTSPLPGTNSAPNFDDSLAGSEYDFDGATGGGSQANVSPQQGGGGGGAGLSGGASAAFGDSGGGGSSDEPLNKDILTGMGSSSGGAAGIFGGGGYADGPAGSQNKGGSVKGEDGFDLRAFLPGGKKDPTRNPASAGYSDPTITKANGLTNWQKVTRKMNEKRPELLP